MSKQKSTQSCVQISLSFVFWFKKVKHNFTIFRKNVLVQQQNLKSNLHE